MQGEIRVDERFMARKSTKQSRQANSEPPAAKTEACHPYKDWLRRGTKPDRRVRVGVALPARKRRVKRARFQAACGHKLPRNWRWLRLLERLVGPEADNGHSERIDGQLVVLHLLAEDVGHAGSPSFPLEL